MPSWGIPFHNARLIGSNPTVASPITYSYSIMKLQSLTTLAAATCLLTLSACDKAKETAAKQEQDAASKLANESKETAAKLEDKAKETAAKIEDKAKEVIQATEDKAKEIVDTAKEKIEEAVGSTETYAEADKAAFNAALEPVKKLYEEVKTAGQSGEPPFDKMGEFIAAMKAIPTTGMPAELKDAMAAANDKAEELIETMKPLAADPAAATPEVQAKIGELMTEGKALGEKAIELAAKHGIDLSFMK